MEKLIHISDVRTLKAMERAGNIELLPETGSKISTLSGTIIKCTYIDDGDSFFKYKGEQYRTKYVSGSFYPYVFLIVVDDDE